MQRFGLKVDVICKTLRTSSSAQWWALEAVADASALLGCSDSCSEKQMFLSVQSNQETTDECSQL